MEFGRGKKKKGRLSVRNSVNRRRSLSRNTPSRRSKRSRSDIDVDDDDKSSLSSDKNNRTSGNVILFSHLLTNLSYVSHGFFQFYFENFLFYFIFVLFIVSF